MNNMEIIDIKISDIVYNEALYPRQKFDKKLASSYADNLKLLPPIEINQDNILIDGKHRIEAHKLKGIETIKAKVIKTTSEQEIFILASQKNASHGNQLSKIDKKNNARKLYIQYKISPDEIAKILSVAERTVREVYINDILSKEKEYRDNLILTLHKENSNATDQEIADIIKEKTGNECSVATINRHRPKSDNQNPTHGELKEKIITCEIIKEEPTKPETINENKPPITSQENNKVQEGGKNLETIVKDEKTDEEKKEENPVLNSIEPTINNKEITKNTPELHPDISIEKQPLLTDNSLAQGDIYFAEENYEEALKCFNESLKNFEDVLLKKSIVLGRINKIGEALDCLDILLKLSPKHQEALSQKKIFLEILNPPDNGDKLSSELINKTYKQCLEVCPEIIDIQKTKEPNKEKELKSLIYMILNNLSIREAVSELKVSFSSIQRCQDKLNKKKIINKLINNNILPKNEKKKPGKQKKV